MKNKNNLLLYIGFTIILITAILKPMGYKIIGLSAPSVLALLMGIGTICLAIYFIKNPLEGKDKNRIIRLRIQIYLSLVLYSLTAYYIFSYYNFPYWIYTLLIAALIDFIVTIRANNI